MAAEQSPRLSHEWQLPGQEKHWESKPLLWDKKRFCADPGSKCERLPTDQRLEKLGLCHDVNISLQKKFRRNGPCVYEWYFPLCKEGFVRSYQGFLAKKPAHFGDRVWIHSCVLKIKKLFFQTFSQKCTGKLGIFSNKKHLYSGCDEDECLIL